MDDIRAQDLPAFLDPLLDFCAEHLPEYIYDVLFTALSYTLLLVSGIFSLLATLPSWKPWEWDAQKVLPPLISILAAYYTIVSLYRTTGWMLRLGFRIAKWGIILAILASGFGWLAGSGFAQESITNAFQGNQKARNDVHGRTSGQSRSRRPRPWDSFDIHRQWRYDEHETQRTREANDDAFSTPQRAVQYILGIAGRVMTGTDENTWKFLNKIVGSSVDEQDTSSSSKSGKTWTAAGDSKRKTKSTARRHTRSR